MAFLPHDVEANTLLPPLNNTFMDYNSNNHHLHHHQQQHQQQQSGLINATTSGFASPVFTDFESQLSHEIHAKEPWQNPMDSKQHLKLQPKAPFGGITDFTSYQSFVDMGAPSWDAKLMLPSSSAHESLDAISVSDIWGCHGDVKEPSPAMPSSSSQPFSDISKMFNNSWGGLTSSITLPVDPSKGFLEGNDLHSCSPVMSTNLEFPDQRQAAKIGDFSRLQFSEPFQMQGGDANANRIAPKLSDLGSVHSSPNGSNFAGLQGAAKQAKQAIAAAAGAPAVKDGSLNRKRTMSSTVVDADAANESDGSMGQEVSSNAGSESASHGDKPGKKRRTKNVCKDGGPQISYPKDSEPNDMKGVSNKSGDNNDETKQKTEQQSTSINSGDSMPKTAKDNLKPPEPMKPDYIHVRARRGQATDSHSLAERVRREKISERMKFLQDLVPGCSKVTGKAVMLDEIINYVQSLQRQVEFLSMKLAAVNPRVDCSIDGLFGRDMFGPRVPPQQPLLFPTDNSTSSFPSLHPPLPQQLQPPPLQGVGSCPPLDVHTLGALDMPRQPMNASLPPIDNYGDSVSQVQRLLTSFLNAKTRSSGC